MNALHHTSLFSHLFKVGDEVRCNAENMEGMGMKPGASGFIAGISFEVNEDHEPARVLYRVRDIEGAPECDCGGGDRCVGVVLQLGEDYVSPMPGELQ